MEVVRRPEWMKPEEESPTAARRIAEQGASVNFGRAAILGICAAIMMVTFVDVFVMLGATPFSYEEYLGSLFRGSIYGTHNWTYGFFINWVFGALFGCAYGIFFEYAFKRANAAIGAFVGLMHAAFVGVVFFPLFNALHELLGMDLYTRSFGVLGAGLSHWTPFLIVGSHLLFGATMGLFYGPTRMSRVHARVFEPGDSGLPGEPRVIRKEDDPEDRVAL